MTYAEYCATKCEGCKCGNIPEFGFHSYDLPKPDQWMWAKPPQERIPCTASSSDQFEQELQERIASLEITLSAIRELRYKAWERINSIERDNAELREDKARLAMVRAASETARECDEMQAQLEAMRAERNSIADSLYEWQLDFQAMKAELERKKQDWKDLADLSDKEHAELDRLRKALEELAKDGCVMGWNDGRTCIENNDTCFGICTGCLASRALNQQATEAKC